VPANPRAAAAPSSAVASPNAGGAPDAISHMTGNMAKVPLLTAEEGIRLSRAIRSGGARSRARAREALASANTRLVVSVAKGEMREKRPGDGRD
jgi:DNA-directed RNA polymerase sigma subunit (sigma70/sigma32)